jgi:hypothetical protein
MRGLRPCASANFVDLGAQRLPLGVVAVGAAVDAADRADLRVVATPHLFHRVGDLAERGAGRFDGVLQ